MSKQFFIAELSILRTELYFLKFKKTQFYDIYHKIDDFLKIDVDFLVFLNRNY